MDKVIVIVGPTGVGKTNLSIALAQKFHGEIISGDSMQIYKEMTIGTAKIKPEEKADIPHYLLDMYSFKEDYNVKTFQEKARIYMKDIKQRNGIPIICGGTGLYIKSVIYDYQFVTQKQDVDFMQFLESCSNDELWSLLKIIDPVTCEKIHHNNRQRIVRALAMAHAGEKKSEVIEAQQHQPIYDTFIIGLTMDRQKLYEKIDKRVDQMIQDGLLDEITQLVTQHENIWELQSFQGIGYKEWVGYFNHLESMESCIEKIKKNSRNYAKRQYTWFRNQMNVHWYDTEEDYKEDLFKEVKDWIYSN